MRQPLARECGANYQRATISAPLLITKTKLRCASEKESRERERETRTSAQIESLVIRFTHMQR
jgi:hypothetical protein